MELIDGAGERCDTPRLLLAFGFVARRLALTLEIGDFAGDEFREPGGQRLGIFWRSGHGCALRRFFCRRHIFPHNSGDGSEVGKERDAYKG
ncbi:MAG: hypothetical protein C0454_13735 [Parvibaculum sp.]|nr:hypothetical protein [Parvibaculum sp.]